MRTVYLDYAATTPIDEEVLASMLPYFDGHFGNPSSLHASGRRAARVIANARERVARTIGASANEIIFTGSGTESDNLAILGTARAHRTRGKHIIISAIEHKAVLEAAHALILDGFDVSVAPVDQYGMVDPSDVAAMVRDDTTLVSVMLANNEIGTTLPIATISKVLKERRMRTGFPLIHTDACQAAGHIHIDVVALDVDLMTLNGSKVYGPKGIGVLYKKHSAHISPQLVGGEQEMGFRAGTESVPLIVGLAMAIEKAERLREKESMRLAELRVFFINGLRRRIPGIMVNGHPTAHLPHIVHVTVPDIEGESMLLMLDESHVEIATGSACSARDLRPSHVLSAIGQSDDLMHGSIRFSFGRQTNKETLEYVLRMFPQIVERLRMTSALTSTLYAKQYAGV